MHSPESAPLLRALDQFDRGHVVVFGEPPRWPAPKGVRTAQLALPREPLPEALWAQELDEALRENPGDLRLPPREYARQAAGKPAEQQGAEYLETLVRLNGGRVLLTVQESHPHPWPEVLPEGAWLVLCSLDPSPSLEALATRAGAEVVRLPRAERPDLTPSECGRLARRACDILLQDRPGTATWNDALEGLWDWVARSGEPALALRTVRSEPLARRLHEALEAMEPGPRSLRLATAWQAALAAQGVRSEAVGVKRAALLLRMGAVTEAWQAADLVVNALAGREDSLAAEALSLRGQAALRREQVWGAVEDCTRAVELCEIGRLRTDRRLDPAVVGRARWALALALLGSGSRPAAQAQAEQAVVLLRSSGATTDLADLYQDLAGMCLKNGDPAQAVARCGQALEILEGSGSDREAEALARRARVRRRLGQPAEAARDMRLAADLYRDLLEAGRLDLEAPAAQAHYDLALLLVGAGDLESAREELGRAIRRGHGAVDFRGDASVRPLLARAYGERGLLHMRLDDLERAVLDCSRAIELGGELLERDRRPALRADLARAYNNRAQALARRGEPEMALRDYQRAASQYENLIERQRRPEFRHHLALVHHNRGGVHAARGDAASTHAAYSRAVDLFAALHEESRSSEVARDLAAAMANRGLASVARGDAADALVDFTHALELLSDHEGEAAEVAAACHGRGRAWSRLGRWAEAVHDFTRALDHYRARGSEALAEALMERGRAHQAQGDHAAAAGDFEECAAVAGPSSGNPAGGAGRPLRASGAPLAAAARAEQGRALAALGEVETAMAAFDAAVEALEDPAERARALHDRGMLRLRCHGSEAALEDLDRAAQAGVPAGTWAAALRKDRCRVFLQRGALEQAVAEADQALQHLGALPSETSEAARLLAQTLALRGAAAMDLGRRAEALGDLTRSIAAFSRLADDARDLDMGQELAWVYNRRAAAHRAVGDTRNALFDYGWAVDLFRELSVVHGRTGLEEALAAACAARALLLLEERCPREAVLDLEAALDLGLDVEIVSGKDLREVLRRCQEDLEAH